MNNEYTPEEIESKETVEEAVAEASEETAQKADDGDSFDFFDILKMMITATCAVLLILSFVFRTSIVDGPSMNFTLEHKDMLITSNLFYSPKQGDIIIFEHQNYSSALVKRIIATENQTVDIDELGQVYVDGVPIAEPYVNLYGAYDPNHTAVQFPYTVPSDHVFVLGDNRNMSEDSRWFGAIDEQQILGRVVFRVLGGFGTVD